MAGIGFELRKILKRDHLSSYIAAYSMAGLISSGPWVISIISILLLGILVSGVSAFYTHITQFQVSITYLIAVSLILSGFAQHSFTRFISDQLFENKVTQVMPNLNGMMLLVTSLSGTLALLFVLGFFHEQNLLYRLLFMGCFTVLCNIWIITNLLAGLKSYSTILWAFFIAYGLTIVLGYLLRRWGIDGFMLSFLVGQAVLLSIMYAALYAHYPTSKLIAFDFLKQKNRYLLLIATSLCYNLGIWIDKFIFWFTPGTSYSVIGPLRGSLIYDAPIFIAYLALLPGMAVFLLRMETDFVENCHRFYSAIRQGQTLAHIRVTREQMVNCALSAIYDIIKIQAITVIIFFLFGEKILALFHIPVMYKSLLFIDVIGTSLQVVFLAILNVLFYLDKRKVTLSLCMLFVSLNFIFTLISVHGNPFYYGFGFTLALLCVCTYGMHRLNVEFTNPEYHAIMLR